MVDENKTERVQLLMTPSELKAIDDWSFENRIRGRAEAMRRLCQIGLGLDEHLKNIFSEYDTLGLKLPILVELLTKGTKDDNKIAMADFYEKLADVVEQMFSHREALAEIGHASGVLKIIDLKHDPNFADALKAVKTIRAKKIRDEIDTKADISE